MAKSIKNAVISAFVTFVSFTVLGPAGLGLTLGVTAATAATVTFVTTLVASVIGGLSTKGVDASAGNYGTKFASRSSASARQVVYGECRVGGTILYMQAGGTDNHMLHMIVAVAGHEVEDIKTVRFNDIDLTSSTSTISSTTVHTVTNAEFTNTDNANSFTSGRLVRFSKHLGADDQAANQFAISSVASFGGGITSDHRWRGIAYVYLQLVYDAEKFGSGIPAISFIVQGKKCFDPRDSSTSFTSNPALIIRDFLTDTRYGLKAKTSEINDTTNTGGFASAANICDQTVTLADGSTTETRYTANGFTNMSATGEGIINALLTSCAGDLTYTNGQFNLFAGAAQSPTLTITDDDILEPIAVQTNPRSADLFNTVKAIYVDKSQDYQASDAPVLQNSTYLNADTPSGDSTANFVKTLEVQTPFTVTSTMAQRIANITLNRNRQTTTISLTTHIKFLRLQPADWVYVTNERLGFSNKVFQVISTNLELVGSEAEKVVVTKLVLKEAASSVFTFGTSDYETDIAEGSAVGTGSNALTAPASLSASANVNNSFSVNSVNALLTWTNSHDENFIIGTQIQYKISSDSSYDDYAIVSANISRATVRGLEANKTYNIRIRHIGTQNQYSAFTSVNLSTGQTVRASSDIITSEGTAANINNQGNLATLDTVDTAQLVNDAITEVKIASDAVTNAKIAVDAIQGDVIAASAITTVKISDDAITTAKIAANQITASEIASGTITATQIATDTITASNIAAGAIATSELAANAVTAAKITAGTITATEIATDAITTDKIAANQVTAAKINVTDLVLASNGGLVTGSTIGNFNANSLRYAHVTSVGTGAGFYIGYVRLVGGTGQVKTISMLFSDGTFGASASNQINTTVTSGGTDTTKLTDNASSPFRYVTPDIEKLPGLITESRLTSSADTTNIPFAFRYTGTGTVNLFIYAQGDSNALQIGSADARFIKFSAS